MKTCNATLGRSTFFLQRRSGQNAICEILNTPSARSMVLQQNVFWLAFGAHEFRRFQGGEMVTVLPAWVWGTLFRSGSHISEIAFSPRRCSKNQNSERHYWREYDFILHSSSRRMQKARLAHTPSARMQISCNLSQRKLVGFRSYYINV